MPLPEPQPQIQAKPQPQPQIQVQNVIQPEIKPVVAPAPKQNVNSINVVPPKQNENSINFAVPNQNANSINQINAYSKNSGMPASDYVSDADLNKVLNNLSKTTKINFKVTMPRNKWEFPLEKAANNAKTAKKSVDPIYYNTGDLKAIEGLINKKGALNAAEKEYFKQHLASNAKLRKMMKDANEMYKNNKNPYAGGRLPVRNDKNTKSAEILLTKQDKFQTSEHGCWSCSAALLLQGRGIQNVTQEDIRLFRSADTLKDTPKFGDDAHKAYNYDRTSRILEAGDLLTRLAPDSMLRDLEIRQIPTGSTLDEDVYTALAIERLGEEIHKAINVDKSPVSLLRHEHYVTITGIRRNKDGEFEIKYKNSVYDERFGGPADPNKEVWTKLSDEVGNCFGPQGNGVSISWMSDIKMEPNGRISNAPRSNVFVKKDGTLDTSKDQKFDLAEAFVQEERMQNGRLISKAGDDESKTGDIISKDGLSICETAYVNKQLNFDYLLSRSKMNALDKEAENARVRLKNYGPVDESKHPDEFVDKVRCITMLAAAAALKFDKSIQGKDMNEKAQKAFANVMKKERVDEWKKLASTKNGAEIIKGMENGELIAGKGGPVK